MRSGGPIRTAEGAFNWEACRGQVLFIGLNKPPYTEALNTGFITGFSSCGGLDFDENRSSQINSPQAMEFTRLWIKTIKDFGPPDWPNITWYYGKQKFLSGEYGMYPGCDFFAVLESRASAAFPRNGP